MRSLVEAIEAGLDEWDKGFKPAMGDGQDAWRSPAEVIAKHVRLWLDEMLFESPAGLRSGRGYSRAATAKEQKVTQAEFLQGDSWAGWNAKNPQGLG